MISKIVPILLGFSLGLNVSLGVAFLAHRDAESRSSGQMARFSEARDRLPPVLRKQLAAARRKSLPEFRDIQRQIRDARVSLYEALRDSPTDSQRIDASTEELNRLQQRRQKLIVDSILEETRSMKPEEREAYFELLAARSQQQMQGRGGLPQRRRERHQWIPNREEE